MKQAEPGSNSEQHDRTRNNFRDAHLVTWLNSDSPGTEGVQLAERDIAVCAGLWSLRQRDGEEAL
jgi:hypothetical protein